MPLYTIRCQEERKCARSPQTPVVVLEVNQCQAQDVGNAKYRQQLEEGRSTTH